MDDLQSALDAVLNDPEKLNQIMSLAQSMGLGSSGGPGGVTVTPGGSQGTGQASSNGAEPIAAGLSDPTLQGILSAVSAAGGSDKQSALLNALKPYTHGERRSKLEKAFQVARLVKLAKVAMGTLPK